MKPLFLGRVTSVESDSFTIKFEVPGLITEGIAIPLHTMQEPVAGDEVAIFGGDDVLNTFFVYQLTQPDLPCIWKAYDNYLQNCKGVGIQMVSTDGDALVDAGNNAMVHGKSGVGIDGDGGPVDIHNSKASLEDLFVSIFKILSGVSSIYYAAGMPLQIMNPAEINNLATLISNLFGSVSVSVMSDGGSTGSASASSSPGSASGAPAVVDVKTILTQISTQMKAGIISPMGPCSAPGMAGVDPLISQLK